MTGKTWATSCIRSHRATLCGFLSFCPASSGVERQVPWHEYHTATGRWTALQLRSISWASVQASTAPAFTKRCRSMRGGHSSEKDPQVREARKGDRVKQGSQHFCWEVKGRVLRKDKFKYWWCSSGRDFRSYSSPNVTIPVTIIIPSPPSSVRIQLNKWWHVHGTVDHTQHNHPCTYHYSITIISTSSTATPEWVPCVHHAVVRCKKSEKNLDPAPLSRTTLVWSLSSLAKWNQMLTMYQVLYKD